MDKMKKTQNKGKRKIAIEPITSKTKKQVTFSKRRVGLIKKGSELCSLCGANLAIITFSGAGKLFSFGHPSADAVIQRYVNSSQNNDIRVSDNNGSSSSCCYHTNNDYDFGSHFQQYKDVIAQIQAEKKASTSYKNDNNGAFWWNNNIDELGLVELEHFQVALEGFKNEVATRVNEINSSSLSFQSQNIDFAMKDENAGVHQPSFNGSTGYLIDGVTRRENIYQPSSVQRVDSFVDLLMKNEA